MSINSRLWGQGQHHTQCAPGDEHVVRIQCEQDTTVLLLIEDEAIRQIDKVVLSVLKGLKTDTGLESVTRMKLANR